MAEQPWQPLSPGDARRALLAHLLRREVVVFVGAGVSLAAGLPGWQALVARLGDQLPDLAGTNLAGHDTRDVPPWYVAQHGRERLEQLRVRTIGDQRYQPAPLHRAFADRPVSLCWLAWPSVPIRAIHCMRYARLWLFTAGQSA